VLSTPNTENYGRASKLYTLPTKIDTDFAWLLGLMYGDGSILRKQNRIVISCTSDEPEIMNNAIRVIKNLFNYEAKIYPYKNSKGINLIIFSRHMVDFLTMNSLDKEKSCEIKVPKLITDSESSIRMAFLSGYLDADACICKKNTPRGKLFTGIRFVSTSFTFIESIKDMLPPNVSCFEREVTTRYKDQKHLTIRTESWILISEMLHLSCKIKQLTKELDHQITVFPKHFCKSSS